MTPWRYRHPYQFAALIFAVVWVGVVVAGLLLMAWFGG